MSHTNNIYISYNNTIKGIEHSHLVSNPSVKEIKDALFLFKPFKAPGPDGIHPFFDQRF